MRLIAPQMTDKDFLTHDHMQINKTWKYYWKERITWVTSKLERRKIQREKSEARRRINRFIRRSSKNELRDIARGLQYPCAA